MLKNYAWLLVTAGSAAFVLLGCAILGVTLYMDLPVWLPSQAEAPDQPMQAPGDTPLPPPQLPTRSVIHTPQPTSTRLPSTASATLPPSRPSAAATSVPATMPGPFATLLPVAPPATAAPLPTQTLKAIDARLSVTGALPTPTPAPSNTPPAPAPSATPTLVPTTISGPADTPTPTATPTQTSQPSPTSSVGRVGQRMVANGIGLTVVRVYKESATSYLVIEATVENISWGEGILYSQYSFSVKDSDGVQYDPLDYAPDPALGSDLLSKGGQAQGNVAFYVPETAQGFIASYDLTVLGSDYPLIRIDLGQ